MEFTPLYSSSRANLYRVDDGRTPLLIECGVRLPEIKRALGFRLNEIRGALLTHAHMDHARGAEDVMRAGVDLYCSEGTASALGLSGHWLRIVEPMRQFQIGTWTILPFSTEHDCPGSLGFLLASGGEKLVFITDSFYVRWKFNGLTHVAIECNYSKATMAEDINPAMRDRLIRSHMSLENCLEFFKANDLSKVREIHLLHLSSENSDAAMFRREVERATGKPTFIAPVGPGR